MGKEKRNQQLFNLTPGSEFLSFVGYLNLSFDSRADNLSTIIVSQRPCADWYEWLGGKYIADGVADRIINFYYLIELKGESRRALARKQAKEAAEL